MDVYEQLSEQIAIRESCRQTLQHGNMAAWESKEYSEVEIKCTEKIIELREYIAKL